MQAIIYNIKLVDYISDTNIRSRFRDEALKVLTDPSLYDCETFVYYNPDDLLHVTLINDALSLNDQESKYGNLIVPIDFKYEESMANQKKFQHLVRIIQLNIDALTDECSAVEQSATDCLIRLTPLFEILYKMHTLLKYPPHQRTVYYSVCVSSQIECAYMISKVPNHCISVRQRSFILDVINRYGSVNNVPDYIWTRGPDTN